MANQNNSDTMYAEEMLRQWPYIWDVDRSKMRETEGTLRQFGYNIIGKTSAMEPQPATSQVPSHDLVLQTIHQPRNVQPQESIPVRQPSQHQPESNHYYSQEKSDDAGSKREEEQTEEQRRIVAEQVQKRKMERIEREEIKRQQRRQREEADRKQRRSREEAERKQRREMEEEERAYRTRTYEMEDSKYQSRFEESKLFWKMWHSEHESFKENFKIENKFIAEIKEAKRKQRDEILNSGEMLSARQDTEINQRYNREYVEMSQRFKTERAEMELRYRAEEAERKQRYAREGTHSNKHTSGWLSRLWPFASWTQNDNSLPDQQSKHSTGVFEKHTKFE